MALNVKHLDEYKISKFLKDRNVPHIVFTKFQDADFPRTDYKFHCQLCSVYRSIGINNLELQLSFDHLFKCIEEFCNAHSHLDNQDKPMIVHPDMAKEMEELEFKLAEPYKLPNNTFLTASKIKEVTESITGVMGDIQIHLGGRRVSVSQELLKWIAKVSNFNVDIQAFVHMDAENEYRALCSQCREVLSMSYDTLVASSTQTPDSHLAVFCKAHRHDGSVTCVPSGRKFRDAV